MSCVDMKDKDRIALNNVYAILCTIVARHRFRKCRTTSAEAIPCVRVFMIPTSIETIKEKEASSLNNIYIDDLLLG